MSGAFPARLPQGPTPASVAVPAGAIGPPAPAPRFGAALRWTLVAFLFLAGLGIRLYGIREPFLAYHATRQYHSAIIARAFYYDTLDSIPEWKRNVARAASERFLEPPLIELAACYGYRLWGAERLWIPQLFSTAFWLIGGAFLYDLARRIFLPDAAWVPLAFYLLLPYGSAASRSFQPDPLMTATMVVGIWAQFRYFEAASTLRFLVACLAAAAAILVKLPCVLHLLAAFIALSLACGGLRKGLCRLRWPAFVALSVLPAAAYMAYGMFIADFLQGQEKGRFLPHLLTGSFFWRGLLDMLDRVVGYPALVGGLLGTLLVPHKCGRSMLGALWLGHLGLCLVFPSHAATHDYYHLPLIAIVALSLGGLGEAVVRQLRHVAGSAWTKAATVGLLLLAAGLAIDRAPHVKYEPVAESQIAMAEAIGEAVGHSTRTVLLAYHYGLPLQYHGEFAGRSWESWVKQIESEHPGPAKPGAVEILKQIMERASPEYFLVTDFRASSTPLELKDHLLQYCAVAGQDKGWIVIDLRTCRAMPE